MAGHWLSKGTSRPEWTSLNVVRSAKSGYWVSMLLISGADLLHETLGQGRTQVSGFAAHASNGTAVPPI